MMKKNGFTLAEVLITLGIIGVVAALTIPVLMNYASEREAVSKVKKAYAVLAQALTQMQLDENCVADTAGCLDSGGYAEVANIAKGIGSHLKVADAIYSPSAAEVTSKNWIPDKAYFINGAGGGGILLPTISKEDLTYVSYSSFLLLNDGTVFKIVGMHGFIGVVFDINGLKKPNQGGKDQFTASLVTPNHKSISPYWYPGDGDSSWAGRECYDKYTSDPCRVDFTPTVWGNMYSPTAYILSHDKLLVLP